MYMLEDAHTSLMWNLVGGNNFDMEADMWAISYMTLDFVRYAKE